MIKDSVFRRLFLEPKYALQLYRVLHPEDITATEKLIDYCVEHDILPEYLLDRREEVNSMVDVIFDDSIHQVFEEPERDAVFILWIKMWINSNKCSVPFVREKFLYKILKKNT